MQKDGPKVGVGVIVKKDGKVLVGQRKSSHGQGTWSFPGGHLEFGETVVQCALRETKEETGLSVKNAAFVTFTEDFFSGEKHYVTLFVSADYDGGEVEIMEPEKWQEWKWFSWSELPEPLFLSFQNLLKQGYSPFE
ncbi:MAG: NUDIX hydrolase [Minisyncoccia bacterium]